MYDVRSPWFWVDSVLCMVWMLPLIVFREELSDVLGMSEFFIFNVDKDVVYYGMSVLIAGALSFGSTLLLRIFAEQRPSGNVVSTGRGNV